MEKDCKKQVKTLEISDREAIVKRYKIRAIGEAKSTIEITIPKEAFEREARRLGLTLDEALEKAVAVWRYDNFPGLFLSFERKGEEK